MVDIADICKFLNITKRTVMKSQEMFKLVHDHLKTTKMCKHAVKKLPYLLKSVRDQ